MFFQTLIDLFLGNCFCVLKGSYTNVACLCLFVWGMVLERTVKVGSPVEVYNVHVAV